MRQRADWMTRADEEILEYLDTAGNGTPKVIADQLGMHNDYVGQRCRLLTTAGLLSKPGRGLYMITDDGHAFLAADLDASTLPDPAEDDESA